MNGMEIMTVSADGIRLAVQVGGTFQKLFEELIKMILLALDKVANKKNAEMVFNSYVDIYRKFQESIEKQEEYLSKFTNDENVLSGFIGDEANISLPTGILLENDEKIKFDVIGDKAFQNKETLETLVIPDTYRKIENGAFWGCKNLLGVMMDDGLETIGKSAFYKNQKLEVVVFPKTLKKIDAVAFEQNTAIEQLQGLEKSRLEEIGAMAFAGCENLEEVKLPKTVRTIGWGAFRDCKSIRDLGIPDGCDLSQAAFQNCSNLTTIVFDGDCVVGPDAFQGCDNLEQISVVKGAKINLDWVPENVKIVYRVNEDRKRKPREKESEEGAVTPKEEQVSSTDAKGYDEDFSGANDFGLNEELVLEAKLGWGKRYYRDPSDAQIREAKKYGLEDSLAEKMTRGEISVWLTEHSDKKIKYKKSSSKER